MLLLPKEFIPSKIDAIVSPRLGLQKEAFIAQWPLLSRYYLSITTFELGSTNRLNEGSFALTWG